MAEEVPEKTVKELKRERTAAKSRFTRQTNFLSREVGCMSETELKEEFHKLSGYFKHLLESNDDYKVGLLLETTKEASDDLEEALDCEIEKAAVDAEEKFKEIKEMVQRNLWSRYGQDEVKTSILEAERNSDAASGLPVRGTYLEGYEVHLTLLNKRMQEVNRIMSAWEKWIPVEERRTLEDRIRGLKATTSNLELRKVEFVTARRVEEEGVGGRDRVLSTPSTPIVPIVRIKPTALPVFAGNKRDFYRWKKDWESLQKQGEPSGSAEVMKIQLLNSVDGKIAEDLRLSTYSTAGEIFRVLQNRFGNKESTTIEILEELEKIPPVKGNQPRKVINLIQSVEKALTDLIELGASGAIKNPLVTQTIESKLPDFIKRDWLTFLVEPKNGITSENHFDELLQYLKRQENILERLEQLKPVEKMEKSAQRPAKTFDKQYASTRATKKTLHNVCVVCGDGRHADKIFFCKKFKQLDLHEKQATIEKLRACKRCLGYHEDDSYCMDSFLCRNKDCKKGGISNHHYFLCPKADNDRSKKVCRKSTNCKLTDEQQEFLSQLSPGMAEKCKNAFTNNARKTQSELLEKNGLCELPVIMMLMEITANAGQKIGTLIDLASDTNYITHKAAERLKLQSEKVTLVVHGVGGMAMKVLTRRYLLRVRIKTPKGTVASHELVCYGLNEIAKVHDVIKPEKLKKFFPDVDLEQLKRPKEIELLISHREGRLAPQRMKVTGDLVLWESPLGITVGGAHPELFEDVEVLVQESRTHFARSMRAAAVKYEMYRDPSECNPDFRDGDVTHVKFTTATNHEFLKWWRWESIGAACEPKCGGCQCGKCQAGGKEMTLAEEKELEIIKEGLTYVMEDIHVKSPHWDAKYPWKEDPVILPNNKHAVELTFLKTERQLDRDPSWKAAYTTQIHEMIERGAAVELTEKIKRDWVGPVWYVSHLVALNPHSVTTPVRLVWNSSQRFKEMSMNDLLLKGPDVLNPIRVVLLRFRSGVYAALGDIKKMYNSVWLEEREMHLHRFLWRDKSEGEIREFAITRVNIGDRPAGCIAQVAMRETAKLPVFVHLEEERRVIEEDSYVDDILTSHNSLKRLDKLTEGVEKILQSGGFFLKPWVRSHQSGRQRTGKKYDTKQEEAMLSPTIVLPNQMKDDDNKALGVGYHVAEDKLYILTSINFSNKKKKMRLGKDLLKGEVRSGTPDPLTRRELLSQVAGLYDPIGLVAPAKQKGAILVRKAFQETGGGKLNRSTWDKPLSASLREEAIKLFEEYVDLGQIKFHRSITPADWIGKPWGVTFSDGSDKSYGAVMYLRWATKTGFDVRFVESKAKLTPLDQKGDAIKAELCGAVFASRLRKYFENHGRVEVERWIHLIDSQTVLGAIKRESYGYRTFFANRVGEIQKAGSVEDWWWIPGELNIADIITRGASPEGLKENSAWQDGPAFLKQPIEGWPMKSANEVAASARESVNKLQRKSFTAVITRAQAKKADSGQTPQTCLNGAQKDLGPAPNAVKTYTCWRIGGVVPVEKFSDLARLVSVIAWVRRAVEKWLGLRQQSKQLVENRGVLTPQERKYALMDLFLDAQESVTFSETTLNRLVTYKDADSGLLMCGGRIQRFNEDKAAVPVLPYDAWVSVLVARDAHQINHDSVPGTLLRMREKAWVIRGRRLAKKVVDGCIICRKATAKRCQQIMSDLPPERISPARPFEFTTLDLFGPYKVKDDVKKRVTLKVWGIVFCCMASRAIHADVVSDASSEGFLLAYQRFTSLRGHPRKLWSDPGTNFVGAKPSLEELHIFLSKLNKAGIEETASKSGTEWSWKFHPPDSPHRNGSAEAGVKLVKRALSNLGGGGLFTWSEFQTFLFMAANLVNERPIDARVQSQEECVEYISPNSLLLGRVSPKGDVGGFQFEGYSYKRLKNIQIEVNKFWKNWSQLAGPNLFVRNKWHTKHRNVSVGDVIWLADQNALRSQYKLGRVIGVNADEKGIVRDVLVKTFPSYPAPLKKPSPSQLSDGSKTALYPATVLHRDVRRVVVLLPVEEQKVCNQDVS